MFCRQCGKQVTHLDRFCGSCGSRLERLPRRDEKGRTNAMDDVPTRARTAFSPQHDVHERRMLARPVVTKLLKIAGTAGALLVWIVSREVTSAFGWESFATGAIRGVLMGLVIFCIWWPEKVKETVTGTAIDQDSEGEAKDHEMTFGEKADRFLAALLGSVLLLLIAGPVVVGLVNGWFN